jgi:hypothetical protein
VFDQLKTSQQQVHYSGHLGATYGGAGYDMTCPKYKKKHGYLHNDRGLRYLLLTISIDIASGWRVAREFMEAISIVCSSFLPHCLFVLGSHAAISFLFPFTFLLE